MVQFTYRRHMARIRRRRILLSSPTDAAPSCAHIRTAARAPSVLAAAAISAAASSSKFRLIMYASCAALGSGKRTMPSPARLALQQAQKPPSSVALMM